MFILSIGIVFCVIILVSIFFVIRQENKLNNMCDELLKKLISDLDNYNSKMKEKNK